MRILHLYSGNLYGGIESMLVTFARSRRLVPELEHEFALSFGGRLAEELDAAGAKVHQLGKVRVSRPHTVFAARGALRKVLAEGNFDVAIGHAAWSYAMFAPVVRRAGLPVAFWAHDAFAGNHWTERWARRTKPDLVLSNSNYTGASCERFWPDTPRQVIYCPVEDASRPADLVERAATRAEFSTPDDAVVFIQASRIERWKGHETLVAALAHMRDNPAWHCWIAGGPQRPHEAEYFRKLQGLAADVSDRVHFLGQRSDIPRLLAAADIYCQPNLTPEPFGIALVEALYAGLPVVTSAMGGAREIVTDDCGVLVSAGDSAALAGALTSLVGSTGHRARLSAAGPARAEELSDPARQSQLLLRSLTEFLSHGNEAHG